MTPASSGDHDARLAKAWQEADAGTRAAVTRGLRRGTSDARTAELVDWRARTGRARAPAAAAVGFALVVAGVTAFGVGPLVPRLARALGQGIGVIGAITLVQRNTNLSGQRRAREDFKRLRGRPLPGAEPPRPLPLWALLLGVAGLALLGVGISVGLGLALGL